MNLRKKIFQPKTYLWVSCVVLITACASTPVKAPIIAGVLEIERYPDTKFHSISPLEIDDCAIPGDCLYVGFNYSESAPSEQNASDAVKYYQKELIKTGWTVNKVKPTEFTKDYGRNRNHKTELSIGTLKFIDPESYSNPELIWNHRVTFNISEQGRRNNRHSKTIVALREFYALSKRDKNKE